MTVIDDITRRLQGRYLAMIYDVTGIPGQAPAIVVGWNDGTGYDSFFYDTSRERDTALSDALMLANAHSTTHDVCDNTLI